MLISTTRAKSPVANRTCVSSVTDTVTSTSGIRLAKLRQNISAQLTTQDGNASFYMCFLRAFSASATTASWPTDTENRNLAHCRELLNMLAPEPPALERTTFHRLNGRPGTTGLSAKKASAGTSFPVDSATRGILGSESAHAVVVCGYADQACPIFKLASLIERQGFPGSR